MQTHDYRQAFSDRDLDGLVSLLADDVVFHSPVISEPGFEGRDSVAALYAMVLDSFSDVCDRVSSRSPATLPDAESRPPSPLDTDGTETPY
jgi:SnoaL-like domain